jgi:hypothetical protein
VTTVDVDAKGNPQGSPTTHSTSPEQYVVEDLRKEARAIESKKPDAPFKKNWHELAVKDILDLAANEGYDKVAFAPGIEQVKRYENNLRKAVDKIDYVPAADGSLMINGIKEGRSVFAGKLVDGAFVGGNAEGKTLSEVFGSSIAKQIEEEAPVLHENVKSGRSDLVFQRGVIEGDNLTIGGEGMKSFYDQRLPSFVKNYAGKEFKAPTGYMEFEGAPPKAHSNEDLGRMIEQIVDEESDELMERSTDLANEMTERALSNQGLTPGTVEWEDAFDNVVDEMNNRAYNQASIELARERLDAARPSKKLKAFSVDVTPEMKEKITTQGQKLFAATPAIGLGAAQVPQQPVPEEEPAQKEQPQTSPEVPQAFQKGGKVGITAAAIKRIMGAFTDDIPEVLSPKKTQNNLEKYIEKSKVKKRVFHGSNNPEGIVDDKGFYNYDPGSAEIHWTTDDPDFADRYTSKYMESHGDQGAIFPVHIQLQNPLEVPFDMNTRITPEVWKYAEDLGFSKSDFKEWLLENDMEKPKKAWQVVDSPEFREAAAYRGFDGISAKEDGVNTWGVFAPTQIKSTFNQGTYDVKDPDIGKRDGGPVGFQSGGKVGNMKNASEALLRVLHGSPTKVRLDREKNLDVTTDTGYAMKRARDKMEARGIEGPPMLNKFDIPAAKMLRFEEQYSPEDVAKMKRFYGKLPEGKAMTGEEIYDATGGKDYVLEGLTRAGGFSGYQRPAGGSGGIGDWYRVTDQEALTRKARGGFIHGYADGGGKVDLTRRGLLGLRNIISGPTQNLPAVIPKAPLAEIAKEAEKPDVISPLVQLAKKTAETPMSRRAVLQSAIGQMLRRAFPGMAKTTMDQDILSKIDEILDVTQSAKAALPVDMIGPLLAQAVEKGLNKKEALQYVIDRVPGAEDKWALDASYKNYKKPLSQDYEDELLLPSEVMKDFLADRDRPIMSVRPTMRAFRELAPKKYEEFKNASRELSEQSIDNAYENNLIRSDEERDMFLRGDPKFWDLPQFR